MSNKLKYICFIAVILCITNIAFAIEMKTLSFEENKGQIKSEHKKTREDIFCKTKIAQTNYFFTKNSFEIQTKKLTSNKLILHPIKVLFRNSLKESKIQFVGEQKRKSNYFNGTPIVAKHYDEVYVKNIYKDIDVRYYFNNNQLEFDFIVDKTADYKNIALQVNGAKIEKQENGTIKMKFGDFMYVLSNPIVFQNDKKLKSYWKIHKNGVLTFEIEQVKENQEIIIDPIVKEWGTYFGGEEEDKIYSSCTDQNGNLFVFGSTKSSDNIASVGSFQQDYFSTNFVTDGFVSKFNNQGELIWSSYYGHEGVDIVYGGATSSNNELVICGKTESLTNIAFGSNPHSNTLIGGFDGFIMKLDENGFPIWGTYYGGYHSDEIKSVSFNSNNEIYATGETESYGFISSGPGNLQHTKNGGKDGFIVKFSPLGERLWSTYFGGGGNEIVNKLLVDNSNNILICGTTFSSSPVDAINPVTVPSGHDGFILKLNPSGARIWGKVLNGGSSNTNELSSITCDSQNNVYTIGHSRGFSLAHTYPPNCHQCSNAGNYDLILSKYAENGNIIWSTYIGGGMDDFSSSIVMADDNHIVIGGKTDSSTGIASSGSHQSSFSNGSFDGCVIVFNSSGNYVSGTYFGGMSNDEITSISINQYKQIFATGNTGSISSISSNGALNENYMGGSLDGFIVRFSEFFTLSSSEVKLDEFNIYPNPAIDKIKISSKKMFTDLPFVINSIDGKLMQSGIVENEEIILKNTLQPGMYFLKISGFETSFIKY